MARQMPPLNQLRVFEAAALHDSIKKGAEALCVPPAAVGHQIKVLELALNTSLFRRKTRKIMLTAEGRELSDQVGKALDALEDAAVQARKHDLTGTLKITIAPFFGNRWLLPRLPDFHEKHPGIEIKTSLSFDYVDLGKSGFDAAVRYGAGNWDGLTSTIIHLGFSRHLPNDGWYLKLQFFLLTCGLLALSDQAKQERAKLETSTPKKTSTKSLTASTIGPEKCLVSGHLLKPTKLKPQTSLLHFNFETAKQKSENGTARFLLH